MDSHNFHICSEQLSTFDYTKWLNFLFIMLYLFVFSFFRPYLLFSFVFSFFCLYFVLLFIFSFFCPYFVLLFVFSLFCMYLILSFAFSFFRPYFVLSFLLHSFVCRFFNHHKLFISSLGSTGIVLMSS